MIQLASGRKVEAGCNFFPPKAFPAYCFFHMLLCVG